MKQLSENVEYSVVIISSNYIYNQNKYLDVISLSSEKIKPHRNQR